MNDEVLVKATGVSKRFCRDLRRSLWYGLRDMKDELLGNPGKKMEQLSEGEFWANRSIDFELRRGECLGLIGHNGAGKTTLLKMLNGLIKPDTGEIEMKGKVGALIALGAGFNPVLTGRENIYVNGVVLGLSRREVSRLLDEIVDFAEIEDAIDSPVRNYSSGMQVRLGFAIATASTPDILLVDEVLAVGDMAFRRKCQDRMQKMTSQGASVVLVTHNLGAIMTMTNRTLLLDHGRLAFNGDTDEALARFSQLQNRCGYPDRPEEHISVDGRVQITSLEVDLATQRRRPISCQFSLQYKCNQAIPQATALFAIHRAGFQSPIATTRTQETITLSNGSGTIQVSYQDIPLTPGKYQLRAAIGTINHPTPISTAGYESQPLVFEIPTSKDCPPQTQDEIVFWPSEWRHRKLPQ